MANSTENLDEFKPASEGKSRPKFPLDGFDISKVSDETLTALFDTAPVFHNYEGTRIVRLSQTLILKGGMNARPCEAHIMNYVSAKGGSMAAIPKVYRVLNIETENIFFGAKCLIVMDYIEGRSVEECWGALEQRRTP